MRRWTFWHVHPTKTQISLCICTVWSVFIASTQSDQSSLHPHSLISLNCIHSVWSESSLSMKKLCILHCPKCAQWRFRSDCTNAQSDLNLHWTHVRRYIFLRLRLILVLIWNAAYFQSNIHWEWREVLVERKISTPIWSKQAYSPRCAPEICKYNYRSDF